MHIEHCLIPWIVTPRQLPLFQCDHNRGIIFHPSQCEAAIKPGGHGGHVADAEVVYKDTESST